MGLLRREQTTSHPTSPWPKRGCHGRYGRARWGMPPPSASANASEGAARGRISPLMLRWLVSLALLLPVILLYAANYLRDDGSSFTGFIQYDQSSYMADARKSFDGGFHFLYSNPFSPDAHSPGIYFHAHLFVLGLIRALTGADPGTIYVIFGFFAALVAVRVAMALYEEVAGLESTAQWMGLVVFIWGGGVLAITGLLFHLARGSGWHETVTDLFHFDPGEGWWFLNFGRNLVFPTEAYYHALAFGAVLAAMERRFRISLWLAVLLSFSHPFTGLEFPLILVAWCGVEAIATGKRSIPFAYGTLLICVLAFHLFYNLGLLNLFPEHVEVFRQWSLPWNVPLSAWLPADLLVGGLALWALSTQFKKMMAMPANRLLLTWFVVAFILSHHDLILQPRQPLHFERGYVWTPLFFLGIQPLLGLLRSVLGIRNASLRFSTAALILLFLLSDNIAWVVLHS